MTQILFKNINMKDLHTMKVYKKQGGYRSLKKAFAQKPSIILKSLLLGKKRVRKSLEREFRPVFMTSTTGRSADPIPFLYTHHDLDNLSKNRYSQVNSVDPKHRKSFKFADLKSVF